MLSSKNRTALSAIATVMLAMLAGTSAHAGRKEFLKLQGRTVAELTPPGWTVAPQGFAAGDLNKDSVEDWAIVFETAVKNKKKEIPRERVLVVAVGSSEGKFTPLLTNDRLILKKERASDKDPFDGVEILNRVLQVDFSGAAGWEWDAAYKFRWENGDFYLIGSEHHSTQQSDPSNEYRLITYYPTSKYEVAKPRKGKQLIPLENSRPLKLGEVGPARTFEPHVEREGLARTR
jgi:hypothetical protein